MAVRKVSKYCFISGDQKPNAHETKADDNESHEKERVSEEDEKGLRYGAKAELSTPGRSYVAAVKNIPPTAAKFESNSSTRAPRVGQDLMKDSQAILHDVKSLSTSAGVLAGLVKSISSGRSVPVSTLQTLHDKAASKVPQRNTSLQLGDIGKIPEGIYVVCDHFLKANPKLPQMTISISPCEVCKNLNTLKYAIWNYTRLCWQEIRPYPALKVPPKVTLKLCRHFLQNRQCPKVQCTFPHGEIESAMWKMEREGGKYNYTRQIKRSLSFHVLD